MDTAPDPRPELTAAQRIAIALGTAGDPRDAPTLTAPDVTAPAAGTDLEPAADVAPGPPA